MRDSLVFTSDHLESFRALSGDENPLHVDAAYASRSQFGRPVLYGTCAAVWALGRWVGKRSVRIRSIKAQFRKPIFIGEPIDLVTEEISSDKVRLAFYRGSHAQ